LASSLTNCAKSMSPISCPLDPVRSAPAGKRAVYQPCAKAQAMPGRTG
jgi:hypothetical protein